MKRRNFIVAGVVAILAIVLVSHVVRSHAAYERKAKELTLRKNLASIRNALKSYEAKHHEKPASLADLVRDGELKAVPIDPITGSSSTWTTSVEETVPADDFSPTAAASKAPRIIDVQSGARGADSGGRRWSEY